MDIEDGDSPPPLVEAGNAIEGADDVNRVRVPITIVTGKNRLSVSHGRRLMKYNHQGILVLVRLRYLTIY
jgi:hypothetical protein